MCPLFMLYLVSFTLPRSLEGEYDSYDNVQQIGTVLLERDRAALYFLRVLVFRLE